MKAAVLITVVCLAAAPAQQQITVLEPNGGETFAIGDTMHVLWDADQATPLVMIEMSVDGGEVWYGVYTSGISFGSPEWGDYAWVIPDSLYDVDTAVSALSSLCRVRVRNYIDQVTNDISDSNFTVAPRSGVRGTMGLPAFDRNRTGHMPHIVCTLTGQRTAHTVSWSGNQVLYIQTFPVDQRRHHPLMHVRGQSGDR